MKVEGLLESTEDRVFDKKLVLEIQQMLLDESIGGYDSAKIELFHAGEVIFHVVRMHMAPADGVHDNSLPVEYKLNFKDAHNGTCSMQIKGPLKSQPGWKANLKWRRANSFDSSIQIETREIAAAIEALYFSIG